MFYKKCITIIMFVALFIFAQDNVEDTKVMDHGSNQVEWVVYETEGPAVCFSLSPTHLWFSNGNSVGNYDMRTKQKKMLPTLGDMPSSSIKTIGTAVSGDVWFGGDNGAILYSKNKFELFTKGNGLPDSRVTKILCVSGSAWVGTKKGISEYKNGRWVEYTSQNGVCGEDIRDITTDDKGAVYFATNNGIAVYQEGFWTAFDRSNGTSSNDVKAVGYDPRKDELWAAMGKMDVDKYNGKEWNSFMDIQEDIVSIMADTQSRIWFGSLTGILKYNGFAWVTNPEKIGFQPAQVTQMYKDSSGDLYFAIDHGVMHMTNPYPY